MKMSKPAIRSSQTPLRLLAVTCLVMMLIASTAVLAGCGASDESTPAQTEEVGQSETGSDETAVGSDSALSGEDTSAADDSSIEAGSTEFSLEKQTIGEGIIVPDAKIHSISWSDRGDYFRIEFTMGLGDGGELTGVPNCSTGYTNEYYSLAISFNDIRTYQFYYPPFADPDVPVSLGDPVVEYMQRKPSGRDEPIWFEVVCAHSEAHPGVSSRPHRLMYSSRPGTVILDIQKL
jgi:hypothetical protein